MARFMMSPAVRLSSPGFAESIRLPQSTYPVRTEEPQNGARNRNDRDPVAPGPTDQRGRLANHPRTIPSIFQRGFEAGLELAFEQPAVSHSRAQFLSPQSRIDDYFWITGYKPHGPHS